jgi:hypothetical protein
VQFGNNSTDSEEIINSHLGRDFDKRYFTSHSMS